VIAIFSERSADAHEFRPKHFGFEDIGFPVSQDMIEWFSFLRCLQQPMAMIESFESALREKRNQFCEMKEKQTCELLFLNRKLLQFH
jgi:hypothetical protein